MSRKLWTFHGGLHLPGHKAESTTLPPASTPVPRHLILPLHQHIGEPAKALVQVGDKVLKGQMIARPEGYVSAPVHASSSGTVVAIEERPVPHPSGLSAPCIVIETDGEERWTELHPVADYHSLDASALRNRLREAGIVGLGGAGFPSFIKLNPGPRTVVDTLILNGAECEPYITCDDMLMREQADEVIAGLAIMGHALQARHKVIGVEDNKPEAYAALCAAVQRAGGQDVEVVQVPTRYPAGGEKQLIKVLTGKEVASGGLPIDIGIVCHNVGTTAAIYRAIVHGEPLISRLVTVSGGAVAQPRNFMVRIGTPIGELLQQAGTRPTVAKRIVGGPMMGFAVRDDQVPVVKTTNCILALTPEEARDDKSTLPCIRCGACAEVCPVSLLPQQLYWHAKAKDFDKVQDYNLFDCIECGCCAYVCPSDLPLVQYYRFAKTEIWAQEREKKKSDLARQRHEFRQERIEQEKAEREARMKQKKAALEGSTVETGEDPKKAAIQAALDRVKAKRAEAEPNKADPAEATADNHGEE